MLQSGYIIYNFISELIEIIIKLANLQSVLML